MEQGHHEPLKKIFSWYEYMIGKLFLKYGDAKIEKRKFHFFKSPIGVADENIDKIVISDELSCTKNDFKYFVSYEKNEEVTPFSVLLPKMSGYVKNVDDAKTMCFLIKNEKILVKYREIWGKIKKI